MDIYDIPTKKFLSYDQIIEQFGNHVSFLDYCSILAAIPQRWKLILKSYSMSDPIDITTEFDALKEKCHSVSKYIYWDLIEKNYKLTINTKEIWQANLNITRACPSVHWSLCYILC